MTIDIPAATARHRRLIADLYDGLAPDQLDHPSLCAEWTVRDILGHLVMPLTVGLPRLMLAALRHRSIDRASTALARELARTDVGTLTALLRERADRCPPAPGVGPLGQYVDGCIHLRDVVRPLGLDADIPPADWRPVLAWLPTRAAHLGHVPAGLLDGLSFRAADQDWCHGTGPVVEGPSEALALAMTGRAVALADLAGPGVPLLAERYHA